MNFEALVKHISTIQNTLQAQAAHAVNLALTSRNWFMGCYIVEFEQNGEDRATYGEQLLKKQEQRLKTKDGVPNREIWRRYIYPVYAISERTFYNMLKASADPKNDLPDDTVQLKFNFDWE